MTAQIMDFVLILIVEIVQEILYVNALLVGLEKIVLNLIVPIIVEVMEFVCLHLIAFVLKDGMVPLVISNHVSTIAMEKEFVVMELVDVLKDLLALHVNRLIVPMVALLMVFVIVKVKNVLVCPIILVMIVQFQLVQVYVPHMVNAIIQQIYANVKQDGMELIVVFQFV
jgi:hypothetical protein